MRVLVAIAGPRSRLELVRCWEVAAAGVWLIWLVKIARRQRCLSLTFRPQVTRFIRIGAAGVLMRPVAVVVRSLFLIR